MASDVSPVYSPRYTVTLGGKRFQEAGGRISNLVVESTIDGADRFSLTVNRPFDPAHGHFSGLEWDDLKTGTQVEVSMGWGGNGTVASLFTGRVQSVRADFSPDTGPVVGASGYGKLHEMMVGTNSRSWSDTDIGDVLDEVLSSYFGDRVVEDADVPQDKIIQHNQSDYRFVRGLATRYGYHFYTHENTVYFTPRMAVRSEDPALTLRYGEAMDSFSVEINESNVVQTVEVRHWDMENETEIVGSASTDAVNEKKRVYRIPCRSRDEADRIAETELGRLSESAAEGYGEADGNPAITAGVTLRIEEMGDRFSGNYHVTKATHRMGRQGYRTSFEVTEIPT